MPGQSTRVPPGSLAPDFRLATADGRAVQLSDYRGRASVVLVFLRNAR